MTPARAWLPMAVLVLIAGTSACRRVPESAIPGVSWEGDTIVAADLPLEVSLLDPRLVSVVLEHALRSDHLYSCREFYRGDDPTPVAFEGRDLPVGFIPVVDGFEFTPASAEHPLPPNKSYLVVSYELLDGSHDLVVGFSNAGGRSGPRGALDILGGRTNYYDLDRSGPVLRIEYTEGIGL